MANTLSIDSRRNSSLYQLSHTGWTTAEPVYGKVCDFQQGQISSKHGYLSRLTGRMACRLETRLSQDFNQPPIQWVGPGCSDPGALVEFLYIPIILRAAHSLKENASLTALTVPHTSRHFYLLIDNETILKSQQSHLYKTLYLHVSRMSSAVATNCTSKGAY